MRNPLSSAQGADGVIHDALEQRSKLVLLVQSVAHLKEGFHVLFRTAEVRHLTLGMNKNIVERDHPRANAVGNHVGRTLPHLIDIPIDRSDLGFEPAKSVLISL